MFSSLNTALTAPLPEVYNDPSAPLILGKEDSEIDVTIKPRDYYEFPISIRVFFFFKYVDHHRKDEQSNGPFPLMEMILAFKSCFEMISINTLMMP